MKHRAETEEGMKTKRKGKETLLKYMKKKREPKMERETLLKPPFLGLKKKNLSRIPSNALQTTCLDHNIAESPT